MKKRYLIALILPLLPFSLPAAVDSTEHAAEEFYGATLYARAAELYETLLEEEERENWRLRLAQCLFYLGDYKKITALLNPKTSPDPGKIYLLGTAHSRLGNYPEAIALFEMVELDETPISNEIRFEKALAHFQSQNYSAARPLFEALVENPTDPLPRFYLARLEMEEGNFCRARELLASANIAEGCSLIYECRFLTGKSCYYLGDYKEAIEHFEKALPSDKAPWAEETCYHLGWSYLKEGENSASEALMVKAAEQFRKLLARRGQEKARLALGQTLLTHARLAGNAEILAEAESLLSDQTAFTSREGKSHALLLRAQAADSHARRDALYRQLTHEDNRQTYYYGQGWYLRGLNDFEEGERIKKEDGEASRKLFDRAASSFGEAGRILSGEEKALALQFEALSYMAEENRRGYEKAEEALTKLLTQESSDPEKASYLHALATAELEQIKQEPNWTETIAVINKGLEIHPSSEGRYLLGILQYRNGEYAAAEKNFSTLSSGEALFWASKCIEAMGGDPKECRRRVYELYPDSQYADEAYFTTYTYKEYLQGGRAAIKHLEGMAKKYPSSPFLLNAHYLIGMNHKRERKSPEGKRLSKRDLNAAIEGFHRVETLFDTLYQASLLTPPLLDHAVNLRYYATLERALSNLAIAEESEGAKRQIFLEYAEEVFKKVLAEFQDKNNRFTALLRYKEPYPQIEEESTYWLAKTYLRAGRVKEAQSILDTMENRYKEATITRGYFLSRMWYEKGLVALERQDFQTAIQHLQNADDAAKGKILTSDEKLDLWIQQSYCYRGMKDYDNAILILTRVTNEDAISGLRLKAMFLRAEVYALQQRTELARNQLKALAKKGGEWAYKANKTLEEQYGY